MAMGMFNRTKGDESSTDPGPATAPASVARQADLGVPVFRPALNKAPAAAPKPTAAPAEPTVGPRPADRRTLVVGRGITLQGTVADAERLVVEGTVDSKMIHAAELFVAQAGVFKGEVEVDVAEIAGTFDGSITARGSLTIRATGAVSGVTRCRKLSVEEGGQLSGQMAMLTDAASAEPVRPPAPSVRAQV
jgi:cytoskeletal protein CcmA (bactofilin family)